MARPGIQSIGSKTHRGPGRPTKRTPQLEAALLEAVATGAPYAICCASVGISLDSFMDWKRTDPDLAERVEKIAAQSAMRLLGKIEKHATDNFAAASWILERRFPELFSRPEVQLNLIQQNNTTLNSLSITISEKEVREIEAAASTERENVRQMFSKYRQGTVDYNDGEKQRILDVETEMVKAPEPTDTDEAVQQSVKQKFAQYKPEQSAARPPIVRGITESCG